MPGPVLQVGRSQADGQGTDAARDVTVLPKAPGNIISGKPHTLTAEVTRRGSAVKTGTVGFYSGGSLLCFDTDGSDGWSCSTEYLGSWDTGRPLIAKYEQYSWGSGVTTGPARVGIGDLLTVSDFTLALSDGQTSGTNVDRIPLGADTVRLTRDGQP